MAKNFKIVWPEYNLKITPTLPYSTYEGREGRFIIPTDAKMGGL